VSHRQLATADLARLRDEPTWSTLVRQDHSTGLAVGRGPEWARPPPTGPGRPPCQSLPWVVSGRGRSVIPAGRPWLPKAVWSSTGPSPSPVRRRGPTPAILSAPLQAPGVAGAPDGEV